MSDEFDFDIIPAEKPKDTSSSPLAKAGSNLMNAAADNLPRVLDMADRITEIAAMKATTEAMVAQKRMEIEELRAQTDDYIKRLNAETDNKVKVVSVRGQLAKDLLADYYRNGTDKVSAEEFRKTLEMVLADNVGGNNGK